MRRIRAAVRLGFFFGFAALVDCAVPEPAGAAARADQAAGTGAFTWLLTHRPGALVVAGRRADLRDVAAIVAPAQVRPASADPCRQAKAGHAAVLYLGSSASAAGNTLLGCGVVLYRDGGAMVVAPL